MFWYLISMLLGALVFAAGVTFERLSSLDNIQVYDSDSGKNAFKGEVTSEYLRQWENLLGYDGNRQEEEYEDR